MPLTAFALILVGAVIHAGWNIVAKKAQGDTRFTFFSGLLMAVVWTPLAGWIGWDVLPTWGLTEWALSLPPTPPDFLLVLIQAGHAAFGHFVGGEPSKHKVVKKYMVLGSGKAQVSYLSTRGKSKAGSRVRLANTVRFFEDINEKLIEWNCHADVQRILLGCPIRLGVLWHEADPPPPFDKADPRIQKVPFDTGRPDLDTLLHIGRQVCFGWAEGNVPLPAL